MLNEAFHLDQDTPIRKDFPEVWIFENVQKYDSLNPPSVSDNLTVLTVINLVLNASNHANGFVYVMFILK